eukprot:jgi/Botrbrau1/7579/Bobra.0159s0028.1
MALSATTQRVGPLPQVLCVWPHNLSPRGKSLYPRGKSFEALNARAEWSKTGVQRAFPKT